MEKFMVSLIGAFLLSSSVQAATLVTSRIALGANDQIDWSVLYTNPNPAPPFVSPLPFTFTTPSTNGLDLTVSIPFLSFPYTTPSIFQTTPTNVPTNFANGDYILYSGLNVFAPGTLGNPGPLSISFANPVFGVGAQLLPDASGDFIGFLSAFDSSNNLLGSFQLAGSSTELMDDTAIFMGVQSDTANIARIVFSTSVPGAALGINRLSILTVPEPTTTLGLLVLGTYGLLAGRKKRV